MQSQIQSVLNHTQNVTLNRTKSICITRPVDSNAEGTGPVLTLLYFYCFGLPMIAWFINRSRFLSSFTTSLYEGCFAAVIEYANKNKNMDDDKINMAYRIFLSKSKYYAGIKPFISRGIINNAIMFPEPSQFEDFLCYTLNNNHFLAIIFRDDRHPTSQLTVAMVYLFSSSTMFLFFCLEAEVIYCDTANNDFRFGNYYSEWFFYDFFFIPSLTFGTAVFLRFITNCKCLFFVCPCCPKCILCCRNVFTVFIVYVIGIPMSFVLLYLGAEWILSGTAPTIPYDEAVHLVASYGQNLLLSAILDVGFTYVYGFFPWQLSKWNMQKQMRERAMKKVAPAPPI